MWLSIPSGVMIAALWPDNVMVGTIWLILVARFQPFFEARLVQPNQYRRGCSSDSCLCF